MTTNPNTDVLIVGAGPTGLALACQLRRLGVAARIVDKSPEASTTSKAIGLQHRVSEVLAWMGIVDRFLARAATNSAVHLHADGRELLALRFREFAEKAGRGAFVPCPIILPQSETEAILGEALRERGGEVERGKTFVRFSQDDHGVASHLTDAEGRPETVTSRYLVSCEGAHSVIRKQAGITFAGKAYPHDFVMADVDLDWDVPRGASYAWFHRDGMISVISLPKDKWRIFVEMGPSASGVPEEITLALIQRLFADRTGDRVTRASNPTWLSRFKIHARMVDRFRAGRVFLAGDAAHLHSPSGGQGITTGVQDAYNLAWKLARVLREGAPAALLDTYSEERLPVARDVLATTDRNTHVIFPRSAAGRWFRNHVALPLLRREAVQRRILGRLSQLDQSYRGRSLAGHHDGAILGRTRVRAGDRTPDVVFARGASGDRTTLFERLGQGRFIALVGVASPNDAPSGAVARVVAALDRLGVDRARVAPASDAASPLPADVLVDVHGDFRRLYGASGEYLYLIRPDGYVGLFTRPVDEATVRAYLGAMWPADVIAQAFATTSPPAPPAARPRERSVGAIGASSRA